MRMKNTIKIICGALALSLGAIGLVLPILPTTPFVLVAAACFCTASPRLYNRLAASRYFGEYISNYREKTGVSKATKRNGLLFLWGMLLLSAIIFRRPLVWAILLAVGAAVTAHILLLRKRDTNPV